MRRFALPTAVLLCSAGLAACSSDGGSSDAIKIKATDSKCEVATTSLPAGDTTFEVTNDGDQVTEVYVYGKGNKVITEKENIGPSTTVEFSTSLSAGSYEIACKPGMKGDGIRTAITVTGSDDDASSDSDDEGYDREVEVEATEYKFEGLEKFTGKVGEKIEFKLENEGSAEHAFELIGPDGTELGEIEAKAGKSAEFVVELKTAGTYKFICPIGNHAAQGMTGTFTVK